MNKRTNTKRPLDGSNDSNKLYVVPSTNNQKEVTLGNEFSNPEIEAEEMPLPLNLYDKLLKFCCSWNFVFISLALLSAFVLYSIVRYWFF